MVPIPTAIMAIILYLCAIGYLSWHTYKSQSINKNIFLGLSIVALVFHIASATTILITPEGFQFGFFKIASLFGAVIALLTTCTSFAKSVENLALLTFPIAILGLISSISATSATPPIELSPQILLHIIVSVFAYSVLATAGGQAILLAAQDHHLKHKRTGGIVRVLPPLQTMESLLFGILWIGIFLLSASIVSGFVFLDDLFAQHMVHKSFLSIAAWVVFAILLAGRHFLGWRGTVAIRWTLAGFFLLMLGYFGSKLVLEVILTRN